MATQKGGKRYKVQGTFILAWVVTIKIIKLILYSI